MMLALGLFVMGAMAIMGAMNDGGRSLRETGERARALDLARSAISAIESGLARPETIEQMVKRPRGGAPYIETDPEADDVEDAIEGLAWGLAVTTEPWGTQGLVLVTVTVTRGEGEGAAVMARLTQATRLSGPSAASRPAEDDLIRAAGTRGEGAAAGGASNPPPAGGRRGERGGAR